MAKKLLTFLGTGNYGEITYLDESIYSNNIKSKFIQESLVNILGEDIEVYIFLTKDANNKHWDPKEECNKPGLKRIFEDNNIKYKEVHIYDGKMDTELWDNFDKIYSCFEDGDEISIDITHSFRSIPILFMGVLNYAKETKNIKVNGIYYGAYEARYKNEDNIEVAPIFDLTLFNTLHKWSIGVNNFLTGGDATELCNAMDESVNHIVRNKKHENSNEAKMFKNLILALRKFSENLLGSRGQLISQSGMELKSKIEQNYNINIKEVKPFKNIIDKIYDCVKDFSGDIINDTICTIGLCKNFGLIQQAYTFLQEMIITKVCIITEKSITSVDDRRTVKDIICTMRNKKDEGNYKNINIELCNLYNDISQYRNDINHCGFNNGAHKVKDFKIKLEFFINKYKEIN